MSEVKQGFFKKTGAVVAYTALWVGIIGGGKELLRYALTEKESIRIVEMVDGPEKDAAIEAVVADAMRFQKQRAVELCDTFARSERDFKECVYKQMNKGAIK